MMCLTISPEFLSLLRHSNDVLPQGRKGVNWDWETPHIEMEYSIQHGPAQHSTIQRRPAK